MKRHLLVYSFTLAAVLGLAGACTSSAKPASGPTTTQTSVAAGRGSTIDAGGTTPAPGSTTTTTSHDGGGATLTAAQNPCSLVSKAEAQSILGKAIADPLEAPQGPTCIYKTPGAGKFVTLGTETVDFSQLKPKITGLTAVPGLSKAAYCGTYGTSTLFVPLSATRLFYVNAPCPVATQFAAKALSRISAS